MIFIFAKKGIRKETEITIDYKNKFQDNDGTVKCKCGSGKKCSGVMGISLKDY